MVSDQAIYLLNQRGTGFDFNAVRQSDNRLCFFGIAQMNKGRARTRMSFEYGIQRFEHGPFGTGDIQVKMDTGGPRLLGFIDVDDAVRQ
jgi:hypothetical protein